MEKLTFQKAVYEALAFVTTENLRYNLEVIKIEDNRVIASNGKTLYIAEVDPETIPDGVAETGFFRLARRPDGRQYPKPKKTKLDKATPAYREIKVRENSYKTVARASSVKCLCFAGTVLEPVADAKFPPYRDVIPNHTTAVRLENSFVPMLTALKKHIKETREEKKFHRFFYLYANGNLSGITGFAPVSSSQYWPLDTLNKATLVGNMELGKSDCQPTLMVFDLDLYTIKENPSEVRFTEGKDDSVLDFRLPGRQLLVCPIKRIEDDELQLEARRYNAIANFTHWEFD